MHYVLRRHSHFRLMMFYHVARRDSHFWAIVVSLRGTPAQPFQTIVDAVSSKC